ncbi:MAG TPA: hypothetical protein VGT78_03500 [Rhizomicrobium sp.]|nr:hypothetical protein [Rhizomicrobium sp.]
MFRFNWLPAIAIGLTLSGAAAANPIGRHAHHQTNSQQTHAEPQASPAPQIPTALQADIDSIANTLKAENARAESKDEKQYASRYLKTQKHMAKWAGWMLVIAGIEAAITLIGVVLVGLTLKAARDSAREAQRAANAAEKAWPAPGSDDTRLS